WGTEQYSLAVARPADGEVRCGMVCQPARHAASAGNDIDIEVALVLAAKCDLAAVRRKDGVRLQADAAGEPCGVAAVAPVEPQVAGVAEGEVRGTDCRPLEKQGNRFGASAGDHSDQYRPG